VMRSSGWCIPMPGEPEQATYKDFWGLKGSMSFT
jgi:hypothetical protein